MTSVTNSMRQDVSDPTKAGKNLDGSSGKGTAVANYAQANVAVSKALSNWSKSYHEYNAKNLENANYLNNAQIVAEGSEAGNIIASTHKNMTKIAESMLNNNANPLLQGLLSNQSVKEAKIANNTQAYKSIGLKFASKDYEKEEYLADEYSSHWEGDSKRETTGYYFNAIA